MVCGNITNLNFSLCTICLNKQLELHKKSITGHSNQINLLDLTIKKNVN